jgi:hypothetical protein
LVHLPVLRHGHCLRDLLLQRGRKRDLERIGRAGQVVMVDMRVMVVMVRLGHLGLRIWSGLWQRAERVRLQRARCGGRLRWSERIGRCGRGPWRGRRRGTVTGRQLSEDQVQALVSAFTDLPRQSAT